MIIRSTPIYDRSVTLNSPLIRGAAQLRFVKGGIPGTYRAHTLDFRDGRGIDPDFNRFFIGAATVEAS